MNRDYKIILLTGFPRSGTTWIGEEISKRYDVDYIFEPFSIRLHPKMANAENIRNLISNYRYIEYEKYGWYYSSDFLLDIQDKIRNYIDQLRNYYGLSKPVLLIKQPLTAKLNWIAHALQLNHIFWIDRHPGGMLASYHRLKAMMENSEREYKLMSAEEPELDKIGRLYFKNCSKKVKHYMKVYHKSCQLVDDTLIRYGNYSRIQYEDVCLDIEGSLKRNIGNVIEYDGGNTDSIYYRKNDHHNTDHDTNKKRLAWQNELNPKIMKGLKRYCLEEKMDTYYQLMPESISNKHWGKIFL